MANGAPADTRAESWFATGSVAGPLHNGSAAYCADAPSSSSHDRPSVCWFFWPEPASRLCCVAKPFRQVKEFRLCQTPSNSPDYTVCLRTNLTVVYWNRRGVLLHLFAMNAPFISPSGRCFFGRAQMPTFPITRCGLIFGGGTLAGYPRTECHTAYFCPSAAKDIEK